MIALLHKRHDGGSDRSHSGGNQLCPFRMFQGGDLLFTEVYGGVVSPGVDITFRLMHQRLMEIFVVFEAEDRGLENGRSYGMIREAVFTHVMKDLGNIRLRAFFVHILFLLNNQSSKRNAQSAECRVQGAECGVQSAEFRVQSAECRVQGAEFRAQSVKRRVQSAECRVQGAERSA